MNLTPRQHAVLEHLRARVAEDLPPPTLPELCHALGLRSRGSLHKHIRALVEAGLVEPLQGLQRGVRLTRAGAWGARSIPLVGRIAAGSPIEALAQPEAMDIPDLLRAPGESYVLQVRGDSMEEAGILDGDYVVIQRRDHARNGEIVVALIDGHEATLKRIQQTAERIILYPANSRLEPMSYPPARVQIQGVVVGQMRSYR